MSKWHNLIDDLYSNDEDDESFEEKIGWLEEYVDKRRALAQPVAPGTAETTAQADMASNIYYAEYRFQYGIDFDEK